ncbi:MAG: aminodeoxychorismate/anthranilate synthase component II [bacterium]|nr:aminodeoxychorismate/anthranilate synthase component II [bacterium]
MILMLDNYDSFTYNLVQGLTAISGVKIQVVRNDVASPQELLARQPQAVVISPGPGIPADAGITMDLITAAVDLPLLGICLGHQALAAVGGARIVRAPEPVHGKTAAIHHAGEGVFAGLPEPFEATRYHSLVADRASLSEDLKITAWTDDGLVMGIQHRVHPHHGVQFHPESYLCRDGLRLLAGFLHLAGVPLVERWRLESQEET